MRRAALALALVAATAATAHAGDDAAVTGARVVFARGDALWATDGKGKGPAVELAKLPTGTTATDVRALRRDLGGTVLLADVAGRWHWLRLGEATAALVALPCAAGDLAVAADGRCVACATTTGQVQLVQLASGKVVTRAVPADGAALVGAGADLALIWADEHGVWSAPAARAADLAKKRRLAAARPLRHFAVSPDGTRAVGVYPGVLRKGKVETPVEQLYTFALDGKAARRKSIRDGRVLAWSRDGAWALVQDAARGACVMRVVGGEYKCWKGFTAVALSGDGTHALVLGPRGGADDADADDRDGRDPGGDGEGGEDEADGDGEAAKAVAPHGPRSLFRATVPGTYTEKPALVETVVDGDAAAWLDAAP